MSLGMGIELNVNYDAAKLNRNWQGIRALLVQNYRNCHIPLFANSTENRKNPEFIGSGFIATHNGYTLVITCAHVVDLLASRRLTTINDATGDEIHLAGEIINHASLDLSIINLGLIEFELIPAIASGPEDADWMYIEGYPKKHNDAYLRDNSEWTPVGLRLRYLHIDSDRFGQFNLQITKEKLEGHGLLEFDLNNFTEDDLKDVPKLFRPKMMSGSPVYLIGNPKSIYEEPEIVTPKLVGVFIEHSELTNTGLFVNLLPVVESLVQNLTT